MSKEKYRILIFDEQENKIIFNEEISDLEYKVRRDVMKEYSNRDPKLFGRPKELHPGPASLQLRATVEVEK